MPASAVIPFPAVYIRVAAVKKLVVDRKGSRCALAHRRSKARSDSWGNCEEIMVFMTGASRNAAAWNGTRVQEVAYSRE